MSGPRSLWTLSAAGAATACILAALFAVGTPGLDAAPPGQQGPTVSRPEVIGPVEAGRSEPVRGLATARPDFAGAAPREAAPRRRPTARQPAVVSQEADPLLGDQGARASRVAAPAPLQSYDGLDSTCSFCNWIPPDTIGDVGLDHYVQAVNTAFAVYDKASGALLAGPSDIGTVWSGHAGADCAFSDPIVLYDQFADRWLLAMMGQRGSPTPNLLCVAISQSADPTLSFYTYVFTTPNVPDYPHFAVWPDAYYVGTNESTVGAYALDRSKMLAGQPATMVRFAVSNVNYMLPSDADGSTQPPAGSPNYFYTFHDTSFWGEAYPQILVYAYRVDWTVPANSTFALSASVPISTFSYTVCGWFNFNCVPQPGTAQKIDVTSEWPMWRLQYRNFGDHEGLVGNFTVNVSSPGQQAGIRWFELRKTSGNWGLYQQGTLAPDSDNRFYGSIALNGLGTMALGYNVSSSTVTPSLRYVLRQSSDPLGTFGGEGTLVAGGGVQTGGVNDYRWGDYSSLNVDPRDDCTFWFTGEYYRTTSAYGWATRIGSFQLTECAVQMASSSSATQMQAGQPVTYTVVVVSNSASVTVTNGTLSDNLPAALSLAGPVTVQPAGAGTTGGAPAILTGLTITPGARITVTIPALVSQNAASGPLTNTVVLTGTGLASSVQASASVNVSAVADVGVSAFAAPSSAVNGQPLTYTVVVTNAGPGPALGVVMSNAIPAGLSSPVFSASQGTCSSLGGILSCALGGLAAGGRATVTIAMLPTSSGVVTNTFVAGSADVDTVPGNNQASVTGTVFPAADLRTAISGLPSTVVPGLSMSYTIVVTNAGPNVATGASITGAVPLSFTGVTWSCAASAGSSCGLSSGSGVISLPVTLASGGVASVTVAGEIDPVASGSVAVSAGSWMPAGTVDPNLANNVSTVSSVLTPQAALGVQISNGRSPAFVNSTIAGEPAATVVTYTVVVTNAGPSAAVGAVVTVNVSSAMTGISWTCQAAAGSACGVSSGTGPVLNETVGLAQRGVVTFTIVGSVTSGTSTVLTLAAGVTAPTGTTNTTPSRSSATLSELAWVVRQLYLPLVPVFGALGQ